MTPAKQLTHHLAAARDLAQDEDADLHLTPDTITEATLLLAELERRYYDLKAAISNKETSSV